MSVLDHDYEDLRVELDGQVAVLTFDRPDALNAFSGAMGRSLTTALRAADSDEAVRVVVITGAGRAFCAGADFSGGSGVFGAPTKETFSSDPLDDFHPWDVRKPVIAAINGHAVGLGLTMTLQCDIRVVAEEAKLGIVQNRRGILPDAHSHWTLPRLVGHTRATEILLTGRMFRGTDAGEWGLATEVLPAADVLTSAMELAHEVAAQTAPISVGASKRLLWMSSPGPDRINELERDIHLHVMGTADSREGVMAFMEKRDPEWSLTLTEDWPEWLDEE
ncbi:MAG: enoyl-CoA hydratase-related protein [Acidimicrobiales bacterium]|jgi:enoyl-CoA hydratase/carnithine racemase|nr:enoyl-CoA hydratase-related protein [Acidimicrobiales bacterium]